MVSIRLACLAVGRGAVIAVPVGESLPEVAHLLDGDRIALGRQPLDGAAGNQNLHGVVERLAQVLTQRLRLRVALHGAFDLVQRIDVSLLGQGILGGPSAERGLLLLLLGLDVEPLQTARHADGVFPVVGRAGIFRGVLDPHLVAGGHILLQDGLTLAADEDALRILDVEHVVDLIGSHVALGRAGESHNHREVALLVALGRYGQVLLGLVGHVVGRIGGRFVLPVGIDTENGEVARMARPHPVVGLAAELADRRRGVPTRRTSRNTSMMKAKYWLPPKKLRTITSLSGCSAWSCSSSALRFCSTMLRYSCSPAMEGRCPPARGSRRGSRG